MEKITKKEFEERLEAQGVPSRHIAFICPRCKTVQSPDDLIRAGAGKDFTGVVNYVGFSCVGRFLDEKQDGLGEKPGKGPCNWTLGGLLKLHELEVEQNGEYHPMFEIAAPEQAQARYQKK